MTPDEQAKADAAWMAHLDARIATECRRLQEDYERFVCEMALELLTIVHGDKTPTPQT